MVSGPCRCRAGGNPSWCQVPSWAGAPPLLPTVIAEQGWAEGEAASHFTDLVNHHGPTPPSFGRNSAFETLLVLGFPGSLQRNTHPARGVLQV